MRKLFPSSYNLNKILPQGNMSSLYSRALLSPSCRHVIWSCSTSIHEPCIFYCFVQWPTNSQLFHKLSHCYMFRHYRVILRQLVINTLPSYTIISIPVPCILYYSVLCPTNSQLFHKLSHCYMFRHYRVILRQLVINTLPSYTSISNAAVGNKVYS